MLYRLLDLPKTLHERDEVPTLVVFDEFQDLLVARQDLDGVAAIADPVPRRCGRLRIRGLGAVDDARAVRQARAAAVRASRSAPLGPLPLDQVLADLGERFSREGLAPGDALGQLAAFAAGHPQRVMLLCYLLAEELEAGRPGTVETAESVLDKAIARTEAAHQALWSQLRRSEKVVLAGIADGLPPASPALAAEHQLGRNTLHEAAERLVDQAHLAREGNALRVIDPLLGEWLRRR